ncbi:MAG: tRNA 2-selenouridine(34) synthase MnmH, partial [Venatoribacter sp.]
TNYAARLQNSLKNIQKRLGGERYQRLAEILQEALTQQLEQQDFSLHRDWISVLLREYYDPMYEYQEKQIAARHLFKGKVPEVLAFLQEHCR